MLKGVRIRYDDPPIPPDPDCGYEGDEGEFWETWVDLPALPHVGDEMHVGDPAGGALGYGVVKAVEWRVNLALEEDEGQVEITIHLTNGVNL